MYDDSFIDYLFDLVEQTKYLQDDAFNYSVIKLIVSRTAPISIVALTLTQVALNEQFMVAGLGDSSNPEESSNRVLRILVRRYGSSTTFGENMIFMLNRASMSLIPVAWPTSLT